MKTEIATALRFGGKTVDVSVQCYQGFEKLTTRKGKFASRLGKKHGLFAISVDIIRWPDGRKAIVINHLPDKWETVSTEVFRKKTARFHLHSAVCRFLSWRCTKNWQEELWGRKAGIKSMWKKKELKATR